MVRHRVVILNAVAEHELRPLLARLPPRRHATSRRLAAEVGDHLPGLVEHVTLLLQGHVARVLVTVPVQANLVAGVSHHGALLRERLQGVAGDEPRGFDVVLVKELEEPARANGASEETSADVAGAVLTTVRAEPASHGVDVHTIAVEMSVTMRTKYGGLVLSPDENFLLAHFFFDSGMCVVKCDCK